MHSFKFSLLLTAWLTALLPSSPLAASEPFGWRVGPAAWSFNRFTFFEAVDKTAALGLHYLEAFEGQALMPGSDAKMSIDLPEELIGRIQTKLAASKVTLTSIYIHELPGEKTRCRQAFEFGRKLGLETIVSEPAPESLDVIEALANEYGINVAIHNHPQGSSRYWHPEEVLKVCRGRGPRIGACADIGHWQRSGIVPATGVKLLGNRLLTLHVKDLNEANPAGHDVPWGTGKGDIKSLLQEVRRLKVKPTLFAIEYEYLWENNSPEIARCADYFKKTVAELASDKTTARSK